MAVPLPQEAPREALTPPALRLGLPFTSHMVLQRGGRVPIFGIAPAGATVRVRFAHQALVARADRRGRWRTELRDLAAASVPRPLRVDAVPGGTIVLDDVVVGDVYLCAGQSNMRFEVRRDEAAQALLADAANRPLLRLFDRRPRLRPVRKKYSLAMLRSLRPESFFADQGWSRCDATTAAAFSAVGYGFGVALQQELGVPIGLMSLAVGGAPIEAFLPAAVIEADPALRPLLTDWLDRPEYPAWCRQRARFNLGNWLTDPKPPMPQHPFGPAFLFAAGIEPIRRMGLRGVLWYQGESNATVDGGGGVPVVVAVNAQKLSSLIKSFRSALDRPDLPFYMVELPGLQREWAPYREAQRIAAQAPGVHLVTTLDLGHPTDVHPRRKQPVGRRLAQVALRHEFGRRAPKRASVERWRVDGGVIRVHVSGVKKLRTADGRAPRCFALAGADQRFFPATARITGRQITLSSPRVPRPVAVRYAFENDPPVNVVGQSGRPLPPFRTDTWPLRPKLRVACIGDSITAGFGIRNPQRFGYPAKLRDLLGSDWDVRGFGSAGRGVLRSSKRGKERRAFLFQSAHRAACAYRPDVVVCNLGINDVMDWRPSSRKAFVEDYLALLQDYAKLPSPPRILLWTPLAPLFAGHRFHGDPRIPAIEAAIAEVARRSGASTIDLRAPLRDAATRFPDRIHPDAAGAGLIAQAVAAAVLRMRQAAAARRVR